MFRRCRKPKRGLTLIELLIAMSIMVIVVGTMAVLAKAVQLSSEYCDSQGTATQHGRVALERICRMVNEATANEQFPGFVVVAEEVSGWRFPDTLAVWHPSSAAADPEGLPRYDELVIYCPDPNSPNQLLEITVPGDVRQVPAADNDAAWATQLAAIKQSSASRKVPLTALLRTAGVSGSAASGARRSAVRFESRLRPSETDWAQYKSKTRAWVDLPWVQGIYGSETGLRQAWLRIELQLTPSRALVGADSGAEPPVPFFGSAAVYYEMHR